MTLKFFRNYRWVRCFMTCLPKSFVALICKLPFIVLSLVFSSFQFSSRILGLVPVEKMSSQWCPLGQAISGPADPEQPVLLRAGACADGVVGPACLLPGGTGEGDRSYSLLCIMV